MKEKTKQMALSALGSAFFAVCSMITVPFAIPFTMQTFALFFLLLLFGGKLTLVSVLIYIALGAIGLPIFSGFGAGVGVLFGPSGGFIWAFALSALFFLAVERFLGLKPVLRSAALLVCLLLCYAFGMGFYMLWYNTSSSAITLSGAFTVCVLPYIIPDILKLLLAVLIVKRIPKALC